MMLKYRKFLDLTDDEIKFILTDIFHPVKIENINRSAAWDEITADITTDGWDDFNGGSRQMTDEITLSIPQTNNCGIQVNFSLDKEDILKWKQFLLAKGCNYLLKDNPYLDMAI